MTHLPLEGNRASERNMVQHFRDIDGQCHCGAGQFRIRVATESTAIECNCSICFASGFLHLPVRAEDFQLIEGHDVLTTYRFNTKVAQHTFCRICGVKPFYRPRSHPEDFSVNVRCLELHDTHSFNVVPFDGRRWEENISRFPT